MISRASQNHARSLSQSSDLVGRATPIIEGVLPRSEGSVSTLWIILENPAYKNSQIRLKNYLKDGSGNDLLNLTSMNNQNTDSKNQNEEKKGHKKSLYKYEDFEQVSTITRGSFGIIELVKHIKTQKPFVFKRIPQSSVKKDKQIQHLQSEKKICLNTEIKKDFIIQWYDSFEDAENLYFVMEFIPGGDLHDMIKKAAFASLEKVKFYFSEVVLAIGKRIDNL